MSVLRAKDCELFVLPNLESCPEQFRESLMESGFRTQFCSTPAELAIQVKNVAHPILLADCGEGEDAALEFTKHLVAEKSLLDIPLLFIGGEASNLEKAIQRFFKTVVTLNAPFLRTEGLEALHYLVTHYPVQSEVEGESLPLSEEASAGQEVPDAPLAERNIQTLVFSQLSQVQKDDFGGNDLKNRIRREDLYALGIFPEDERTTAQIYEILDSLPAWIHDHVCRTAFITESFHRALGVPDDVRRSANYASLLFASAFTKQSLSLLQRNYLLTEPAARADIASKLKDSALHVIGVIQDANAAKGITLMARYISAEETPDDSVTALSASLLTGAELVDRICFEQGFWNPRAAYTLIRSATQGRLDFLHPLAAASMMKFLSEALVSMPKTFLIKKVAKANPEFAQRARETALYTPEHDEEKVPLDHLEPGMRLSKPVYTFDGRKVLSGAVQLDQDLIWRLWRLSAIRPMNTPVVVKKQELH